MTSDMYMSCHRHISIKIIDDNVVCDIHTHGMLCVIKADVAVHMDHDDVLLNGSPTFSSLRGSNGPFL